MAAPNQGRWISRRYHLSGRPSTPEEIALHAISCSPPEGVQSKGAILLIHGFPGTAYQFRHVITPLADAGYDVIAPDYRGAGHSTRPRNGYDKKTMAEDIHVLLAEHMGFKNPVHVVGYDIGGKIAAAYAFRFPEHTASIVWGEGPLPGSQVWDKAIVDQAYGGIWHFVFHWQTDIPELLIDTPEKIRIYFRSFVDCLSNVPNAITAEDMDEYVRSYSQPGGMRSAFDIYRAFHQDGIDNRCWLRENEQSSIPCMTIDGGKSVLLGIAEQQGKQFFSNVKVSTIADSGHYLAEEQPGNFVKVILEWLKQFA